MSSRKAASSGLQGPGWSRCVGLRPGRRRRTLGRNSLAARQRRSSGADWVQVSVRTWDERRYWISTWCTMQDLAPPHSSADTAQTLATSRFAVSASDGAEWPGTLLELVPNVEPDTAVGREWWTGNAGSKRHPVSGNLCGPGDRTAEAAKTKAPKGGPARAKQQRRSQTTTTTKMKGKKCRNQTGRRGCSSQCPTYLALAEDEGESSGLLGE
jgi:hypothetical protein